MKFTLSWLKEHLATDAKHRRDRRAHDHDRSRSRSRRGRRRRSSAPSPSRASSAPRSTRTPTSCKSAKSKPTLGKLEIVCGAPNARAGLVTAFAPIGTYIPGSGITLEARPCAASSPTACSAPAPSLNSIPTPTAFSNSMPTLKVGTPLAEALGLADPVIDIEVTPNRPDWLGVHGIARDLAAAGVGKAHDQTDHAGARPLSLAAKSRNRATARVPDVRRPPHSRREERPIAGMAAAAPARHRPAAAQRAGRYHQLHHLRPRPPAARL